MRRETVQLRILTGGSAEQEKPAAGGADTYIQQFRIAEATNNARFDADNRLWPRPNDPNRIVAQGGGVEDVIRDFFLVFPSLQPFARAGLAGPLENPANDTIYRTPDEYLYSTRHPQSFYRLRVTLRVTGRRRGRNAGAERGAAASGIRAYPDRRPPARARRGLPDRLRAGSRDVRASRHAVSVRAARARAATRRIRCSRRLRRRSSASRRSSLANTERSTSRQSRSRSERRSHRPPLGYEPASSFVAGVNGAFLFDADAARAFHRPVDALPRQPRRPVDRSSCRASSR